MKTWATWNERQIPSRVIFRGAMPVMSRPANLIDPLLGSSQPVTMFTNVVFPAPFAPMMPTISSFSTDTLMSFAAVTAPKVLLTPVASKITLMARPPGGPSLG